MKDLVRGTVVTVVVLIVLLVVNLLCNMNDIHLDTVMTGTVSAVCAMLIFRGLKKKENN